MQHLSRIEGARRNARIARYAIGLTAAAGLAAFAAAARASHPGSHPRCGPGKRLRRHLVVLAELDRQFLRRRRRLVDRAVRQRRLPAPVGRIVNTFRSMGCEVVLPFGAPVHGCERSSADRDTRFTRFRPSSELNRVNVSPLGLTLVSEEFASMVSLALDAARATDGLITPCVGDAIIAAGYDRDFSVSLGTWARSSRRRFLPGRRCPSAGAGSCAPRPSLST